MERAGKFGIADSGGAGVESGTLPLTTPSRPAQNRFSRNVRAQMIGVETRHGLQNQKIEERNCRGALTTKAPPADDTISQTNHTRVSASGASVSMNNFYGSIIATDYEPTSED